MRDGHSDVLLLDQAVVNALRESTGGDEEFLRELVATFVEEAAPNLRQLAAAAAAADAAAIVRPAHTLKSTSATVGAMRLSAICRDIEAAGREGRDEGLAEAAGVAASVWTDTVEALRSAGLAT